MASAGVAMPDGSYYIRNAGELDDAIAAVGRATPNAGESAEARRNSVRRHIMKRARALHLDSKIPDSWNSDGTLKQSDIDALMEQINDYLAHHGVKGMHWGVHRKRQASSTGSSRPASARPASGPSEKHLKRVKKLEDKAADHERMARAHAQGAAHARKEHDELLNKGMQSNAFKRVFGENAISQNEWAFYGQHGMSKAEALRSTANELRRLHNQYVVSANSHAKAAAHLRKRAAKVKHGDLDDPVEEFLDDVLIHFGVKGMHWGVRRRRPGTGSQRGPVTAEAARAARLKTRAQTHGTQSLSNAELQALVTRMNLENQHGRLNPVHVSTGKKIALGLLVAGGGIAATVGKQTVATFAAKYAAQGVEHLIKQATSK